MKRRIKIFSLLLMIYLNYSFSQVDIKPIHAGLALEYGQMRNLTFFESANHSESFTINRTIGWFSQEAIIDQKFEVTLALGGLFFHFFPANAGFDYTKVRMSAVSIAQASASYNIGNIENPTSKISFGIIPYKYNPNSKNLGEYMFRSTPYPNTTLNGTWDLINSSYSKIKGLLFEKNFFSGSWNNDIIVAINEDTHPLHDISLAYITDFQLGPLTLGAGVNFYNLLPARPSVTTPESHFNSWFTHNGKVYYGDDLYYRQVGSYYSSQADMFNAKGTPQDSSIAIAMDSINTNYVALQMLVDSVNNADSSGQLDRGYYTYKGTLLMGRVSLDIGSFFSDEIDFKLYSEIDLLGVKDYPIFYEKKSERVPFMFGISFPTFGLIEYLSVEGEYWKNRYPIMTTRNLVPGNPTVDYYQMSPKINISEPYTKDDWKWSVSAQKSVGRYFTINAQMARDHSRPIQYDFSPYKYETLLEPKSWYYILRIQTNI